MQKTQPRGSELQGGCASKKVMTDRSEKVFSLDFLFIEQPYATEAAKQVSRDKINTARGPADTERYTLAGGAD